MEVLGLRLVGNLPAVWIGLGGFCVGLTLVFIGDRARRRVARRRARRNFRSSRAGDHLRPRPPLGRAWRRCSGAAETVAGFVQHEGDVQAAVVDVALVLQREAAGQPLDLAPQRLEARDFLP